MRPDDRPAGPGWVVGAYPLLPKGPDATPADRAAAYRRLVRAAAQAPAFSGLEVPFAGALDIDELAPLLDDRYDAVVTCIPGVVARLATDPAFGLASADDDGRRRAVDFTRQAHDDARRLEDALGRPAVRAVLVHSSCAAGTGSAAAFARSLEQLAGWDWSGTDLLVEHCDAAVPGARPAKGFLPLSAELDALDAVGAADGRSGAGLGVLVNWGRSAIEGRDPERVVDHLVEARRRGLLRGLMFSGCAATDASRGGAWADVHLPPAPVDQHSLLTTVAARLAVEAAGGAAGLGIVGMKVGAPADASLLERERILRRSARTLLAALG